MSKKPADSEGWATVYVLAICGLALGAFALGQSKLGLGLAALAIVANVLLRFGFVQRWLQAQLGPRKRTPWQGSKPNAPAPAKPKPKLSEKAIADRMQQECTPAILLRRVWITQDAQGRSFLGGTPQLAPGNTWPTRPKTGRPYHHIAQIDLADMPRFEGNPLPATGVLNFYADIDLEMSLAFDDFPPKGAAVDADASGPRRADGGLVVYSPNLPANTAFASLPEGLPPLDHENGQPSPYRQNPSDIAAPCHYPRWPITGHVINTWRTDDELGAEIGYSSGYFEAVSEAQEAARKAILGEAAEEVAPPIVTETRDQDGARRIAWVPKAWAGRAPWCAGIARISAAVVLQDATRRLEAHERLKQHQTAQDAQVDANANALQAKNRAQHDLSQAFLAELQGLDLAPDAALSDDLLDQFDQLMQAMADSAYGPRKVVNTLMQGVKYWVGRAWENPEMLVAIPPEVVEAAKSGIGPAIHYSQHIMLGAPGSPTNETGGHGVRLLQLDSDQALSMQFCDMGILDFWISPDALKVRNWDAAQAGSAGG